MKSNEAPKKIYLHPTAKGEVGANWLTFRLTDEDIEYTRKDALIEKACEYLQEHLIDYWSQSVTDERKFIGDFRNYIKE
jgi:hypothetical protein